MSPTHSYRHIFKATSLFGGVQLVNIMVSVIRSKMIAILLGASGVGMMSLFTSATSMMVTLTGLGIHFSAVKSIAEFSGASKVNQLSYTIVTLRRWMSLSGLLGALLVLLFSKTLSRISFGHDLYAGAFVFLSLTILLQALTNNQLALLQGLRKLKALALANLSSAVGALLLSIPLYYFFKEEGIVPAMVLSSFLTLLMAVVSNRKTVLKPLLVSWQRSWFQGLGMIKLGVAIMLSGFITLGSMYLIRVYIARQGGVVEVGLYAAAWTILNSYIDLFFSAMSTDYFPSLSSVHEDEQLLARRVNEQAEMAVILLTPVLLLLFTLLPGLIRILLTADFLPILPLLMWALAGVLFKAASWCLGFVLLAKAKRKLYFFSELIASAIFVACTLMGYHYGGLTGIGIAFFVNYFIYLMMMSALIRRVFNLSFHPVFLRLFILNLILLLLALTTGLLLGYPKAYFAIGFLTIGSFVFSLHELNKRMELKPLFTRLRSMLLS